MSEPIAPYHADQVGLDSDAFGKTEASASRPSKNNPSAMGTTADVPADGPALDRRVWWHRKNAIVDEWIEHAPNRAVRPISVVGSTTLREEAASPKGDDESRYRSRTWSAVLREFLSWYNGYRFSHLIFRGPDGVRIRTPMQNSFQPSYGDKYYANLKAMERQAIKRFENPTVVMLTLTGSTHNSRGGWRSPGDHIREIIDSFSNHVRPALHRALGSNGADVDEWEYVRVVEPHQSGYGHMHVAVFVDGEVTKEDFHPAIDAHLRHCDPAHRDAHDYYHPNPEKRPISVNRFDPSVDPESGDMEAVGNLGSYVAKYIGTYGEELFQRPIEQLAFYAICWATATRRVDPSNGMSEYVKADFGTGEPESDGGTRSSWKDGVTKEDIERAAEVDSEKVSDLLDIENPGWDLEGIGVVDRDGEQVHDAKRSGVQYVQIDDASHLDPPKKKPPDRPRPRDEKTSLSEFGWR